ncbi:hypothetical protein FA13DRAFT_53525 [Coprinellus micaceus]|uniref:Uncharacterized protein n=1 Tax=Coprinellus micaceus TaxID=71717 RepID=A0A4Y7U2M2_COPMI|nr:hypothetical protein FA13DRAFT_53525 [Coprinellus micaceus]
MSDLAKQVQRRRTRLSHHACRIPLEVLGGIFFMVFPRSTLGRHGRKALVDLCLVCKYWRRAALLKRELWSGLRVGTDYLEPYDKIVAWFERAGSHPKRLKLVDRFCAPNYEQWNYGPGDVGYDCLGEGYCQLYHPTVIKLLTEGPLLESLGLIGASTQCLPHLLKSLRSSKKKSFVTPWDSIRSLELEFRGSLWHQHTSLDESIFSLLPPVAELHLYLPPWLDAQGEDSTNTPTCRYTTFLSLHTLRLWTSAATGTRITS